VTTTPWIRRVVATIRALTHIRRKAGRAGRVRSTGPGDFDGTVHPVYSPHLDGAPDPGEIVWTWVPYEEDASRGKDRPVLIVGRDGPWLLALMLTSKDHSRDPRRERDAGRTWLDIGTGPWDSRRRPSEVRLDRVLRIDGGNVRREGAIMSRRQFDLVTRAIPRARH
jgi:hypothetical protein